MCYIWQQQKSHEITPREVRAALANDLFTEVIDIGLNGGEPTLRKDLHEVALACIESLPRLQNIYLITNGLRPHLVIPAVAKLYQVTREAQVTLSIMISLDGVSDIHDAVRGRKGNFEAVQECMQYFLDNSIGDSHSFGCTLIRENIQHAEKLMLFALRRGIYCRFRVGIPHQRLYNGNSAEPFCLTKKERFHLLNFIDLLVSYYEKNQSRKTFLLNLRNQIAYFQSRKNGCAWQGEGVTLESNGTLSYCAVQSPPIGNLIEHPDQAAEFYFRSTKLRDDILQTKCDTCLHDYNGQNFRISHQRTPSLTALRRFLSYLKRATPTPFKPILRSAKNTLKSRLLRPTYTYCRLAADICFEYSLRVCNTASLSMPPIDEKRGVLVVGWYGTETLGDKAILYSILDDLKKHLPSCSTITVASMEPFVTEYTLSESGYLDDVSVVLIDDALQHANNNRYSEVIFGGGPLMPSITHMRLIAKIFKQIRLSGGTCKIWGCGVGPLRKVPFDIPSKIALGSILDMSSIVVLRDSASIAQAKKFCSSKVYTGVALDPAYFWFRKVVISDELSPAIQNTSYSSPNSEKKILFALRDLPTGEYFSELSPKESASLKRNYNFSVSSLIKCSLDAFASVYLQPMHRLACGGDDRLFYASILEDVKLDHLVNWQHESPVADVTRFLQADVCVVMRYHSLVLALAARRSVLPIDYTSGGKVASLCEALGIKCLSVSEFCDLDHRDIPKLATPLPSYIASLESWERISRTAYNSLLPK